MRLRNYRANLDRGASKFKELAWIFVRFLFFVPFLPLPSGFRVLLLRSFGATIGEGVVIRSRVNISFPWRLLIGDHTWIGEGVEILNLAQVTIGSNCCISQQVFLCTGSHDFFVDEFSLIIKPITIEDECWVAARCFVAQGVTVGRNSLCAAGSIVTKDVRPNTIVGGNPAKMLRRLEA
ncbi:Galactoside O-acetyltransferase [Planctomycetes bacterium CA13]|uniref:Galactoside O-acetyltransferase n=1 Tax=Novipirellula herctigrandis TaxID=2527986 RepID=A0A5C5ZAN3_9BACT|nr:Galactoside O-acetyltransferase [Planctomycetes bacterium CA13]